MKLGQYAVLRKVGASTYGGVYKAIDVIENRFVAMRISRDESKERALVDETDTLDKLRDIQRIVNMICLTRHSDAAPILLTEWIDGETFAERFDVLSSSELYSVAFQLGWILQDLKDRGYCHADLHTNNIMFDGKGLGIKLIDFGLASSASRTCQSMETMKR